MQSAFQFHESENIPIARQMWFATISRLPFGGTSNDASAYADSSVSIVEDFERFFYHHVGKILDYHHVGKILDYLRREVGDHYTADDLCQETFVRAWQHFAKIRSYVRPEGWLFRVATNLALDYLRHQGTPIAAAEAFDDDEMPIEHDMAEQFVEGEQVRQVMLELAPRPRALLVLYEVYDLSLPEVARALGMTQAAAKKMLYRACIEFRRRYALKEGH